MCIIEADVQVDFAPPADYVESTPTAPAKPQAPVAPDAPPPNLEHDSSEDEAERKPKFVGGGQRLDGKSATAKQRRQMASIKEVSVGAPTQASSTAGPDDGSSAVPRFQGASGTLSGKPAPLEPALKADPAAAALGSATTFGPALARTAQLRKLALEREARDKGPTATAAPAAEPSSSDYWASLGAGKTLR